MRGAWLIVALMAQAAFASPAVAAARTGDLIALVVGVDAAPQAVAGDATVRAHLEGKGYRVKIVDQNSDPSAVSGSKAILISASVSGNNLGDTYRHSAIPVITWEPALLPHMGMAAKLDGVDFGVKDAERRAWIVNMPHPAAGGLKAGYAIIYLKNVPMGWAKPGLGASIIATIPGEPSHASVFTYEQGATMDYESIAPARRAFLFLDNGTFEKLTPQGLALFDAMLSWAVTNTDHLSCKD